VELPADKTLITHARTGSACFLGYDITVQHADRKIIRGKRSINGGIALKVPTVCGQWPSRFRAMGRRPRDRLRRSVGPVDRC
jgi:hypothetical protein